MSSRKRAKHTNAAHMKDEEEQKEEAATQPVSPVIRVKRERIEDDNSSLSSHASDSDSSTYSTEPPRELDVDAAIATIKQELSEEKDEDESMEAKSTKKRKRTTVKAELPAREPLYNESDQTIQIGTSGYHYNHWSESYYPHGYKSGHRQFIWYAGEFNTIEINSTFYSKYGSSQGDRTIDLWLGQCPRPTFLYTLKAWRYFTHMKKLKVDEDFKRKFQECYAHYKRLGQHCGPILFQLAPGMSKEKYHSRLLDLAAILPSDGHFVFEFRDNSWFVEEIYELCAKHNWCLAVIDLYVPPGSNKKDKWAGNLTTGMYPAEVQYHKTCDWAVYYRFHGPTGQYVGLYGEQVMNRYAAYGMNWLTQRSGVKAEPSAQHTASSSFSYSGSASPPLPTAVTPARFSISFATTFQLFYYFNNVDSGTPPHGITDARLLAAAFKRFRFL